MNIQTDICDSICQKQTVKCPDNFISSCDSTCDIFTKQCINCIPDCTGHETQSLEPENNISNIVLCPQIKIPDNFCKDGSMIPKYNSIGCIQRYECKK
jgi:hypothetical protein